MRDLIRPDASFTPRELFSRMQGAWFEPRSGYMWQENTGATATTTGGQTVGKLVDLTSARVASQATAANRPIYGVRRNLLTYTEDFSQSVWAKLNCTLIASDAPAPDGSNTAATFRFLNASYAEIYQAAGRAQLAGAFRLGFYTIWIRRRAGSGQVRLKTPTGTGYTDINPTEQWQKFTSATANPYFSPVEYYPGINLNEVGGELDIWHPYLTFADAPDDFGGYQRITTATDYDPGPYPALAHDSTDSLSVALPAINIRRNLLTYSEQFDQWIKGPTVFIVANQAMGPDGYVKADKLVVNTTGQAYVVNGPYSVTGNQPVTIACSFAAAGIGFAYVQINESGGSTIASTVRINLTTGATSLVATAGGGLASASVLSVQQVNSFWRVVLSWTTNAATTNVQPYLGSCDSLSSSNTTAAGTSGIYIFGAQLELGSVATDYQKITDWTSETFSSNGSVYFATPQGMSCLHNQSIGTSYNLPALQTDIYGIVVTPARLAPPLEKRLELYMLRLAGLIEPDYLLDDNNQQLTDDSGELLLRA